MSASTARLIAVWVVFVVGWPVFVGFVLTPPVWIAFLLGIPGGVIAGLYAACRS